MKYNAKAIGQRIKNERQTLSLTQGDFAKKIGLSEESRQTIGKWENGKLLPQFEDMLKMCEVFDCELGYLLGEFDCKTREATDIQAKTGLSEKAIKKLLKINQDTSNHDILTSLDKLIEHEDFIVLLRLIHANVYDFNLKKLRIKNDTELTVLSGTLNCQKDDVKKYLEVSSESLIEKTIIKMIKDF